MGKSEKSEILSSIFISIFVIFIVLFAFFVGFTMGRANENAKSSDDNPIIRVLPNTRSSIQKKEKLNNIFFQK